MLQIARDAYRKTYWAYYRWRNHFFKDCRGVIHVGANTGQERYDYRRLGLRVIWIEPIPSVFATLRKNVAGFKRQRAIQALVTDRDGELKTFHIASNDALSSSIFELAEHKDLWPEIDYVGQVKLKTETLPTVLSRNDVDLSRYDAMLLDTQGADYLILVGADPILHHFNKLIVEASNFEAYKGAARDTDIVKFLEDRGFTLVERIAFASGNAGSCFNLYFKRTRH